MFYNKKTKINKYIFVFPRNLDYNYISDSNNMIANYLIPPLMGITLWQKTGEERGQAIIRIFDKP